MRYYRYVIYPPGGYLHPIEKDVLPEIDAEREAIVHIDQLAGDEGLVVYRNRGEPGDIEERLARHPEVVDHDLFDVKDDTFHLYVRFEPGDPATDMLQLADQYGLIMDTPFFFTSDGGLEITVAGKSEDVQESVPAFMDAVEDIDIILDQVGQYVPESNDLKMALTDRQEETVGVAVDSGYYDLPRNATHEDIAEAVGCSASTVGEHLQKAEAKIIPRVMR